MRRSGSNSTSDSGLNLIPPPIVTSSPLQHLHNTSTARDPRETAISAVFSWSLFKKLFSWNSECSPSREQSCAYLQGLRGLGAITKTFKHQVEERRRKNKTLLYRILSPPCMSPVDSPSMNSFPQYNITCY